MSADMDKDRGGWGRELLHYKGAFNVLRIASKKLKPWVEVVVNKTRLQSRIYGRL